jgi:hypothetical protein
LLRDIQGYYNSVTKGAARPLRSVRICRVRCGEQRASLDMVEWLTA